jgi:A/G-specific adenine glycosylase
MGNPNAEDLLDWYDRHARRLPWRVSPAQARRSRRPDPYRVWLSEVMLQQTTVATVGPYFRAFLDRWPTVADLAAADLDAVLHAWAGLGYYARARNLHKCARAVVDEWGGAIPDTEVELRTLPGIGPYTAAAIAAIAFDRPAAVVDGNVERVMARLFAVKQSLPAAKPRLHTLAESLTPQSRPGYYAQAVMDLGATVCTPRSPKCLLCPWQRDCRAHARGDAESLPRRAPKAERPLRQGLAFWTVRSDGAVLLRRRPERGLLGGMMEVPSSDWGASDRAARQPADLAQAPATAEWRELPGRVNHGFTHFRLELTVVAAKVRKNAKVEGVWIMPETFGDQALPTLTKKVVRHALAHV